MEQWFGGAALLGFLAVCWGHIRLLGWRLASLLVVRVRVERDAAKALASYCWKEFRRSPFGEKRYGAGTEFVQPLDRYQTVGYEQVGTDPVVFWRGWRPLLVVYSVPPGEVGNRMGESITVTTLRGFFDLEKLFITALDRFNACQHEGENGGRYAVKRAFGYGPIKHMSSGFGTGAEKGNQPVEPDGSADRSPDRRYLKWSLQELGASRGTTNPFPTLAFPLEVLAVVERCRRWQLSEKWYKEKDIPWRLGVLLYGQPGTGKSSLVRGVGRELNLPITSYDLASFGNKEFERAWEHMLSATPCIALLEDVDAVFDGRENRLGEDGGGLTFDCLLNCISGVKDSSGVLVFVTTNRPECLDEALGRFDSERGVSTRPGRVDLVVELGPLDEACRRQIAQRILRDCPWRVEEHVAIGAGDTGSQFQERCARTALEHYWQPEASKPTSCTAGSVCLGSSLQGENCNSGERR